MNCGWVQSNSKFSGSDSIQFMMGNSGYMLTWCCRIRCSVSITWHRLFFEWCLISVVSGMVFIQNTIEYVVNLLLMLAINSICNLFFYMYFWYHKICSVIRPKQRVAYTPTGPVAGHFPTGLLKNSLVWICDGFISHYLVHKCFTKDLNVPLSSFSSNPINMMSSI